MSALAGILVRLAGLVFLLSPVLSPRILYLPYQSQWHPKFSFNGNSGSQEIQVGGILIYNFSRNGENVGTTFLWKFLSLHAFEGYFYFGPNFSNAIRVFMDAQSSWGQGLLTFFSNFLLFTSRNIQDTRIPLVHIFSGGGKGEHLG